MLKSMTIETRLIAVRDEAVGVRSFTLSRMEGALPPFTAGAHVDVHLPNGLVRQYSLYSAPDAGGDYEIAVLREPESRGGSVAMHALAVGDTLVISPPRNQFPLDETAEKTLLFAGGIGITPILAMAQRLHRLGLDFELHYCARTSSRAAFLNLLKGAPFAARVFTHFDDGEEAQKLNAPALLATPETGAHLYVCGPGGFMEHVLSSARAAGWEESRLHREYFSAPVMETEGKQPFEIEIASTGQVLTVPADHTAWEVLDKAGLYVPVSCEQGICGTCLVGVKAGIPDHRDSYLTDEEHEANDQFTPCCSRAKSARLVLDL
ncbi:PDR/VanB family oxidoreductase [Acidocella aminolytica]|uniref:Vanillate O-demethylase oxidoreductase n=1 Tax=Acidocella aminolytica 101 = DSM 11237 TaxID=1120923 RepID=A0A0D6PCB5_9PROT|nr:PDR/VanB family oxidoreductase [Acidocella aminolytica]GAN78843.1 vanillate O-demethylase oxidoreductase [Acidocella aminolytica 101 = DSM 11237]GBQ33238.1 flavodoxin reductase family protein [Acidocella aminolytica 101 = DSM 11237]SHF17321.1 vanillate O-demethylase ferredoxin subunit [Acidocella aminolytica 101 = DSM 11237]